MAEVISYINSTGTGGYTTIAAWENDIPTNPTDDYTAVINEDYNADALFDMNVSNSNNVKLKITAASGYRFYQKPDWATSTEAALGDAARCTNGAGAFRGFYTSNCIVEFIEYQGVAGAHYWTNTGTVTFRNCVIKELVLRDAGATMNFYNCFIIGGDWLPSSPFGTNTFINCTFGGIWWENNNSTFTFKNCVAYSSFISSCYPTASGDYNVAVDSSAPGSNSWQGQSGVVVSTTNGSRDLHLAPGKHSSYHGTDESATVGYRDIEDQFRTPFAKWDAGADQILEPLRFRRMNSLRPRIFAPGLAR